MERQLNIEIEQDSTLSKEHPERKKFEKFLEWLRKGNVDMSKLRLRFYESTHRGVHAASNITSGQVIFQAPYEFLVTLKVCYETPVGKQM